MRLEYTSLTARRQSLPSAVGCSVTPVNQVGPARWRRRTWTRCAAGNKRAALFSPALMPGGHSSAMNRYPNEPNICLAMRQS